MNNHSHNKWSQTTITSGSFPFCSVLFLSVLDFPASPESETSSSMGILIQSNHESGRAKPEEVGISDV